MKMFFFNGIYIWLLLFVQRYKQSEKKNYNDNVILPESPK